jgi:hypothetical protein
MSDAERNAAYVKWRKGNRYPKAGLDDAWKAAWAAQEERLQSLSDRAGKAGRGGRE